MKAYNRLMQLLCGLVIYVLLVYSCYFYSQSHSETLSKVHPINHYSSVLM